MHEQSLITALLTQVDKIRRDFDADHVTEVRVEIGPLSGVEPLLLASAFEMLAPRSTAVDAKLVIDEVALVALCPSCRHEFEVSDFVFRCSQCGGNVQVIRGDRLLLASVSLSDTNRSNAERSEMDTCQIAGGTETMS